MKEFQFGIKQEDVGSILKILRSKLYSDPIGSICREVASNSRDANREVGNTKPIEISMQIINSTTYIVFKDEGPGISADRMENIFCNFASSTKRTSTHLTGGFGLGAKTPFAYTDEFNVITNVNGNRYTYLCALDSDNGSIKLTKEEKTKEPNGTEIQIPIKNYDDIYNFERKVVYFTQFWTPRPILINFNHFKYEDIIFSKEYGNSDTKVLTGEAVHLYGEVLALVDEIPYKVDVSKIGISHSKTLTGSTITFVYKKSDVSVSANRETLYFDETTSKTLHKSFNDTVALFNKQFVDRLHSGDYLDYCIKANSIIWDTRMGGNASIDANIFLMINHNNPKVDLMNHGADEYIHDYKDGSKFLGTLSIPKKDGGVIIEKIAQKKLTQAEAKTTYTLDNKYASRKIYWLDESRRSAERTLTLLNEHNGHFMMLTKIKLEKDSQQKIDSFYQALKYLIKLGFEIVRYSTVEKTKIERDKREKKTKDAGTDIITGVYIIPAKFYQKRQNITITADKNTNTILSAVYGKINEVTIPNGVYVHEVEKVTDYKSEHAINTKLPMHMFALSKAIKKPMLILNKVMTKKLENYVTINKNIDDMFYEQEVTDAIKAYIMSNEKSKIQRDMNGLFGSNYYGSTTLTDETIQIIAQIFDLTEDMAKNLKEMSNIVNAGNYYVSGHERQAIEQLIKLRSDITVTKIDTDFKEMREQISNITKKKPLLRHLQHFMSDAVSLEELKKYAYACDVLYL